MMIPAKLAVRLRQQVRKRVAESMKSGKYVSEYIIYENAIRGASAKVERMRRSGLEHLSYGWNRVLTAYRYARGCERLGASDEFMLSGACMARVMSSPQWRLES